jgi:hypothetical protein
MEDLEKKATQLVTQLEKERMGKTLMLGKVVKDLPTAKVILAADPELQVAVVHHVVRIYGQLGRSTAKYPDEWFRKPNVPNAGAEMVRLLTRKQLPFTDEMLAEMFGQLAGINYLSLVEFLDQLVGHVQKRAAKQPLTPMVCKALKHFDDVLMGKQLSPAEARYWKEEFGFPRALDRKISKRIETILAR